MRKPELEPHGKLSRGWPAIPSSLKGIHRSQSLTRTKMTPITPISRSEQPLTQTQAYPFGEVEGIRLETGLLLMTDGERSLSRAKPASILMGR
jgi:hypothetical protein